MTQDTKKIYIEMKILTFCVGNIDNIDSFIPLSVFRLSLCNCDPCLERECSLVNPTSGSGGGRDWGKFVWFETIRLDIILSDIKGVKYGWMVGIFTEASKEDEGEIISSILENLDALMNERE